MRRKAVSFLGLQGWVIASGLFLLALSGCARVRPWERELLADPRMEIDPGGVDGEIDDHIYFSKEASSGGRGFGGGGCGCN